MEWIKGNKQYDGEFFIIFPPQMYKLNEVENLPIISYAFWGIKWIEKALNCKFKKVKNNWGHKPSTIKLLLHFIFCTKLPMAERTLRHVDQPYWRASFWLIWDLEIIFLQVFGYISIRFQHKWPVHNFMKHGKVYLLCLH